MRLNDLGVPCLFVSGKAPRFPMPDLALGCLMKPFTAEDVHRSLATAEDLLRGRETLRPKMPDNLTLYEPHDERPRAASRASSRRSRRSGPGSSIGSPASTISPLEPHHPLARLAHAQRLRGQRRAGIEQRLAPALDVGAALDVLERQQRRDARMGERALDEGGGARPAVGVGLEPGISAVAEEAGDGDVGDADVAEQEAVGRQLAARDNRARPGCPRLSDFSIRASSPGSPQTSGRTTFW